MLQRILRAGEGKIVRRLNKIADVVESLADDYTDLTDAELQAKTDEFKERYADGESLDALLPEAFAVVRERLDRVGDPVESSEDLALAGTEDSLKDHTPSVGGDASSVGRERPEPGRNLVRWPTTSTTWTRTCSPSCPSGTWPR